MKLLARVESDQVIERYVRLSPHGKRYRLAGIPRPPIGGMIAVTMPGLADPNDAAVDVWLANDRVSQGAIRPHLFRQATPADFMDAANAELHLDAARQWSGDTRLAFARDRGGALLSEIRAELAGEIRPASLATKTRRFASLLAIAGAADVLEDLAKLHDVEHLMGLEHAVSRWVANADALRSDDLDALARDLPADDRSAGISAVWLRWWWRLARTCTRADLVEILDRALALADATCPKAVAADARAEAHRLAHLAQLSRAARLWADPPPDRPDPTQLERDESDLHYAAFMALSHAAHAIAHALRAQLEPGPANRRAMQMLAEVAVSYLASGS